MNDKKSLLEDYLDNVDQELNLDTEEGVGWEITSSEGRNVLTLLQTNENSILVIHVEDMSSGNCTDHEIKNADDIQPLQGIKTIPDKMLQKAKDIITKKNK